MHDLIREHARARTDRLDSPVDREQTIVRLLDYYQQAAASADWLFRTPASPGHAALTEPDRASYRSCPGGWD